MKKNELRFQTHIIKSYKKCGGYAKKWASEWQAGPPDLVCSHLVGGTHLVEVKHVPNWDHGKSLKNPMTPAQKLEARSYIDAGGTVFLGVVFGSSDAKGSHLGYFDPREDQITRPIENATVPYVMGQGFDIAKLLGAIHEPE